jgi:hypothetical protein
MDSVKWLCLLTLSGCGFESRPPPLFTVVLQDTATPGPYLMGVWGTAADDVFAVGVSGYISHYDGHLWTSVGEVPTTQDLTGVWGRGPSDVYASASSTMSDSGSILHFDGLKWTMVGALLPKGLISMWGIGDDIWAGGVSGVLYRKQGAGDFVAQPPLPVNPLVGDVALEPTIANFAGASPGSVLAAGGMLALYYFDGATWTPVFRPDDGHFFYTAVVDGAQFLTGGNQFAVSRFTPPDRIELLHEEDALSFNLRGSWAGDANHAVFVGEEGRVLVWDGSQVRSVASGITEDFEAVWGASPDDVWIVGAAGTIVRAQHLF